jgi:hypothetical protein
MFKFGFYAGNAAHDDDGDLSGFGAEVVAFNLRDFLYFEDGLAGLDPPVPSVPGTRIWLQLDLDIGEVRLRVNETDHGVVHTLQAGFPRPVYPSFFGLFPGGSFALIPPP